MATNFVNGTIKIHSRGSRSELESSNERVIAPRSLSSGHKSTSNITVE